MVTGRGGGGGGGGLVAFGGTGGDLVGGTGGMSETTSDLGWVLDGAGEVFDTLFVVGFVWYMLRFFR